MTSDKKYSKIWKRISTVFLKDKKEPKVHSPLTKRILAVNILALFFLLIGFLYVGFYQENLIEKEKKQLIEESNLFAEVLSHTAHNLKEQQAILSVMAKKADKNVFLFNAEGRLSYVSEPNFLKIKELLDQKEQKINKWLKKLDKLAEIVLGIFPEGEIQSLSDFPYTSSVDISEYPDAKKSFEETLPAATMWKGIGDKIIITGASPVMKGETILGVVLLKKDGRSINQAIKALRLDMMVAFLVALVITIFLSLYLARTIALPIKKLALAADEVRRSKKRDIAIPDYTVRKDEIAMLSYSLNEMTKSLWSRMDATERFAADVAHELKNPLSSLKSALETVSRITEPEKKNKLTKIIHHDLDRIGRLITDISDASRLDAELSRSAMEPVSITGLLDLVVKVFREHHIEGTTQPRCVLIVSKDCQKNDKILGIDVRLFQAFQNLIDNALSFSSKDKLVKIQCDVEGQYFVISVVDEGPGIQTEKTEKLFERFYTQRLESETFGQHSGLGLSIVQQVIQAHGGEVSAKNYYDRQGMVLGAKFIVKLPMAK